MAPASARIRNGSPRALKALLVAAALLLGYGPMTAHAARPVVPKPISVQGKLVFKDAHVRDIWTMVELGSGTVYRLPAQPIDPTRKPIPAGSVVRLDCTPDPDPDQPIRCTKVANAEITRAAAPYKSTDLELRLLVLVVSLTNSSRCGVRAGANVAEVRKAYTGELGYSDFLRNCSYGKVVYDNITVISTPVPCSPLMNMCDPDAIAAAAKLVAVKQYGQSFWSSYDRYSYVLPLNMVRICGWVGLAELPGTQTWYTSDEEGVFNKGTVLQESLHNLNIYHGWRYGVEYDDNSTSMGMGNSCPSAPELWRLGWATPLDQLNSTTFQPRLFRNYTLPATYLGPDKVLIKIQPDWLSKYRKNVYLALRIKAGGDLDLLPEFDGKLNVHELNKDIDNNFYAKNDPRVSIVGTVVPSSTFDLSPYKLLIKTEALVDSSLAIKVCRYETSSTECRDGSTPSTK